MKDSMCSEWLYGVIVLTKDKFLWNLKEWNICSGSHQFILINSRKVEKLGTKSLNFISQNDPVAASDHIALSSFGAATRLDFESTE